MSTEQLFSREVLGAKCLALVRTEHWHKGELSSPWTVLYMQVQPDRWLRFFFDAGVFFWRSDTIPDSSLQDHHSTYRNARVTEAECLIGHVVTAATFKGDSGASERELTIEFGMEHKLRFINAADDNTTVVE